MTVWVQRAVHIQLMTESGASGCGEYHQYVPESQLACCSFDDGKVWHEELTGGNLPHMASTHVMQHC